MQNIRVAQELSAYQEGPCSTVSQSVSQSLSYFVHLYTQNEKHDFRISEL